MSERIEALIDMALVLIGSIAPLLRKLGRTGESVELTLVVHEMCRLLDEEHTMTETDRLIELMGGPQTRAEQQEIIQSIRREIPYDDNPDLSEYLMDLAEHAKKYDEEHREHD